MAERMLKFVGTPQAMPDKRPAAKDKAAEQAARCSQCGVPFCQSIARCTTTSPTG
jgi:glutamate synthase (NADPH/NADH) small chain